jgi:uncharacterized cupredoxin-like copper-binding protein
MSEVRPARQLSLLAVLAAVAIAMVTAFALWGPAQAQESTPAATAGCAKASETKGDPAGTPVADANCVEVGMYDVYFDANLITIPSDTDVKFVLPNEGAALHTFVINDHKNDDVENLKINVSVDPGKTGEVTIKAPAGTYYFWCDIPGHEQAGMWGILKVEDDGAISAQSVDNPREA